VKAFLAKVNTLMDWAARIIMINMLIAITLQIIMRYVFNSPLQWSEELARFSYAWFCFFGISVATKDRSHLAVTLLVDRLPQKIRSTLNIFALIIMLVFFILVSWHTAELPRVQGNIKAYSLGVPFYLLHMCIIPSFVVSAFYTVYHLYLDLRPREKEFS